MESNELRQYFLGGQAADDQRAANAAGDTVARQRLLANVKRALVDISDGQLHSTDLYLHGSPYTTIAKCLEGVTYLPG
jgi:hypothetical protein